ncbi:50S ribosomal protein 6 [Rhynchospora pubera]|uniref:50S ribosomal protein 6 n=1 Tax=Rhynchospora pubera TaxID=906938 RepID=A0AAV8CJA2_9POAL|nr:50S ribosomal protein 6 [Rhynchospora pubera]
MASLTSLFTKTPIPTPVYTKPKTSLAGTRSTPILIECSSRPRKKATAHHAKTRPKKHALWDIKREPTKYPPLPPLPPDWTLDEPGSGAGNAAVAVAEPPEAKE